MELLKEVANISGKSGLYRILKPTRTGVIVESIDGIKNRQVIGGNTRVSVLNDISIYTEEHQDSAVPLSHIFKTIHEKYPNDLGIEAKSATDGELFSFLESVAPNFDKNRVYPSDVKKMINWYSILNQHFPEIFTNVDFQNNI